MYRHPISLLDILILLAVLICVGVYFYPKPGADQQAERREQGQMALVKLVRAMHTFKQRNSSYAGAAGSEAEPRIEGSPWIVSAEVPGKGAQTYYRLRIAFANELGFEVRAVPVGLQIADACGTLTLTSTYAPGMLNAADNWRRADCWTISLQRPNTSSP